MTSPLKPLPATAPFLKHVAKDLLSKTGNDFSRTVVIFPNKRAGLFFNEYLMESAEGPIWSPRYLTISELFRSLSPLKIADVIETVCRLHRIYVSLTGSSETLDFFYGWGEKLLADFDDVDKNMADARALFRNLADIKQLETLDFIGNEQEKALKDFFHDFSQENSSRIRENFLALWNKMHDIYEQLNEDMKAEGKAYEGALYRSVTEGLESGACHLNGAVEHYAFVGFNVLDKVEERLFLHLQKEGKAFFYWDYDTFYAGENTTFEAGTFLRSNLEKFPNELPESCFDNLSKDKDIEFVSSGTESAQARLVAPWLEEHLTADEKRTAIVLCNETLLQPVLHALPENVKDINVTKGFPLAHTPAFALVEKFFDEHERKTPESPLQLLEALSEKVKEEALKAGNPQKTGTGSELLRQLYVESYFQTYTILNRFRRLATDGFLDVGSATLRRLLRQVLRQASIPFHGEPAVGLQIMGVLETRNLDFENILMLSVNEGNLPQKVSDVSFIPYQLRREFGLTTARHKTAVYAYYFYRLIQRARHVRMVYGNTTEEMKKGEMSRFMTQLLVETDLPVRHYAAVAQSCARAAAPRVIPKPDNLPEVLKELSPSSLNAYLRCPVAFYFQRVARLKEPEPPAEVIEADTFGNLFHKAAELLYKEKITEKDRIVPPEMLKAFLEKGGDALLLPYVRKAFSENGVAPNIVVEEVLRSYLLQLVRCDASLTRFEILSTERTVGHTLQVNCRDKQMPVTIKGTIDRIDAVDIDGCAHLRVVDYKTGGNPETPKDMEQLFTPAEKHPHYVFQTFIYSLILSKTEQRPIAPALFFVHKAAGEDYDPYIYMGAGKEKKAVLRFQDIAAEFEERLLNLLEEVLDPEKPFVATTTQSFCKNCKFFNLCKR